MSLNDDNFPMARYLVHLDKRDSHPLYLMHYKDTEIDADMLDPTILLTDADARSAKLDVDQSAYYLVAEFDFLESHFRSYDFVDSTSLPYNSSSRVFQMSMDEKVGLYFQSLCCERTKLLAGKNQLMKRASQVSQVLEEIRYMEQIRALKHQKMSLA